MTVIRYGDLPHDAAPPATNKIATDGSTTSYSTLTELVNAARPYATQAEAEAGVSATTGMNPLRTAQAITAIGAGLYAAVTKGVPTGGTSGQVLSKISSTNNDVTWADAGIVTATEWNNAVAYGLGDYASYSSGLYRANVANTNKIPGVDTEWDVVIAPFTGGTLTLPLTTAASTSSAAGFNLSSGVPVSLNDGDLFRSSTALFARLSGGSYQIACLNAAQSWTGTQTFLQTKDTDVSLTLANGVNVGPTLSTTGNFEHVTGPTGAFSIASLTGSFDGQNVRIYNNTSQVMTINHQDTVNETVSPFKRIITPTGANITAKVVTLHYSTIVFRWIVTAYHA